MKTLRGYIFSRRFMGERAPQHVQNIVIREYCQRAGYQYALSATEYAMSGSSLMLVQLIESIESVDGIVAYSLFQLPEDQKIREGLCKAVLELGKELHFAVENIAVSSETSLTRIEVLWRVKQSASNWSNEGQPWDQ